MKGKIQSNGIVERLHWEVKKSLLVEKFVKKEDYDIKIAIENVKYSHNNPNNRVIKYNPFYLFFNYEENMSKIVKENIKQSQKNINKNKKTLNVDTELLISTNFIQLGKNISIKFNKKKFLLFLDFLRE